MLERMYLRYSERKNFKVEITGRIRRRRRRHHQRHHQNLGRIRLWPAAHRNRCASSRCGCRRSIPMRVATSFSSVFICRKSMTASKSTSIRPICAPIPIAHPGAGGQHINKTDSAVRITHMPTGVVVQCQNDRSPAPQPRRGDGMLRAKLYELELRKRNETKQALEDAKSEIGWEPSIRSYVFDQSRIRICGPATKWAISKA